MGELILEKRVLRYRFLDEIDRAPWTMIKAERSAEPGPWTRLAIMLPSEAAMMSRVPWQEV